MKVILGVKFGSMGKEKEKAEKLKKLKSGQVSGQTSGQHHIAKHL